MGEGFVIADWVLALLVTLCALAHLAVLRAPEIEESKIIEHIRWVKIGGFTILSMRFWFILLADGDLLAPPPTEMGLSFVFGAELVRTVYRLFQQKMDVQYEQRAHRRKGR